MPLLPSEIVTPLLALGTEYYLFGAAGLVSVIAFAALILTPALSSYGRTWEKFAAGFLSLFVLAALVIAGIAIGVLVFYEWDSISDFF
jgi:hypothetical protein